MESHRSKAFSDRRFRGKLNRIDLEQLTCHRTMTKTILLSIIKTRDEHRVRCRCQGCEDRGLVISHLTLIFRMTIHQITRMYKDRARYANSNNSAHGANISVQCFIRSGALSSGHSLSEARSPLLVQSRQISIADKQFLMMIGC